MRHRVVIVGGGSAGLAVAARLRRAGQDDIVVVDPAVWHYYQPLWTLVGAGVVPVERSRRRQADLVPPGVAWVRDAVVALDPDRREVGTAAGARIGYDVLVCCPGLELAPELVPGLAEALAGPAATTNYTAELAPKTAELVRRFRGGRALFCAPGSPIKCPGAPQKAAYLSCDLWQRRGVLDATEVTYATGAGGLFGVPEFARVLEAVVERYGIATRFSSELVAVDPQRRIATFETVGSFETGGTVKTGGTFETVGPEGKARTDVEYDLLWAVPPQRAPGFVRQSPLASAGEHGWVPVDRHSLRHVAYPDVFALGDVCDAPTSKTGAAIRRQAPVVARNVLASLAGNEPVARYDGYAACPFTTARGKMVLAEFDYSLSPHPTLPFIDTQRERTDMWLLKRYGLPYMYWNLMLKGLA